MISRMCYQHLLISWILCRYGFSLGRRMVCSRRSQRQVWIFWVFYGETVVTWSQLISFRQREVLGLRIPRLSLLYFWKQPLILSQKPVVRLQSLSDYFYLARQSEFNQYFILLVQDFRIWFIYRRVIGWSLLIDYLRRRRSAWQWRPRWGYLWILVIDDWSCSRLEIYQLRCWDQFIFWIWRFYESYLSRLKLLVYLLMISNLFLRS